MLDIAQIRQQFPALQHPRIFFDNPGGTQAAKQTMEGYQYYLGNCNANHGGEFSTSRESDALMDQTRSAAAAFLNASRSEEIVFGLNMTSLTYNLSRAIVRTFNPGDTIVVTHLDHDANITPWVQAAEEQGCTIRRVDFNPADGKLNLEDLKAALRDSPRLLAVGYASNSLGTINPVAEIIQMAKNEGTLVYIDAVQFAPHGCIDVQKLDCDFLVCSAYKFFGPHLGILYGKYDLLEKIPAFRVRPAPELPPGKFETGTAPFEAISAFKGTLDYFSWVGEKFYHSQSDEQLTRVSEQRLLFERAMHAIHTYELTLTEKLMLGLRHFEPIHLYGPHDIEDLKGRVPTFSFTVKGWHPRDVAIEMDRNGINIWHGNFYALAVTQRLDLEKNGGLIRVGPVHYNTHEEVDRFLDVLSRILEK